MKRKFLGWSVSGSLVVLALAYISWHEDLLRPAAVPTTARAVPADDDAQPTLAARKQPNPFGPPAGAMTLPPAAGTSPGTAVAPAAPVPSPSETPPASRSSATTADDDGAPPRLGRPADRDPDRSSRYH